MAPTFKREIKNLYNMRPIENLNRYSFLFYIIICIRKHIRKLPNTGIQKQLKMQIKEREEKNHSKRYKFRGGHKNKNKYKKGRFKNFRCWMNLILCIKHTGTLRVTFVLCLVNYASCAFCSHNYHQY